MNAERFNTRPDISPFLKMYNGQMTSMHDGDRPLTTLINLREINNVQVFECWPDLNQLRVFGVNLKD